MKICFRYFLMAKITKLCFMKIVKGQDRTKIYLMIVFLKYVYRYIKKKLLNRHKRNVFFMHYPKSEAQVYFEFRNEIKSIALFSHYLNFYKSYKI